MKNIKVILGALSLAALCLGAGCKKGGAAGEMKKFADDICACKDMDCVQKVQKDFADKNKDKKGDVKLSESEAKAVAEASDKMTKCIEKIAGGGGETK